MNIVWFKRDLRIHDHAALAYASKNGPVLPLYILEPTLWQQPDMSFRHYAFLKESLEDLNLALKQLGQALIIKVGDALSILKALKEAYPDMSLWSHEEIWNGWTYERDKKILSWARKNNIDWHEFQENGTVRRLKNRDGWSKLWFNHMSNPRYKAPTTLTSIDELSDDLPHASELNLCDDHCVKRQTGGRKLGVQMLTSFLSDRGEGYTKEMSSPVTAYTSCSRLSPYLAFGCLSVREVYHATETKKKSIIQRPPGTKGKWPSGLKSFSARLRWHCHFIQKLEDQPSIEQDNMHSAYNTLRNDPINDEYLSAWQQGKTGYPMVDACMRALQATGWINFRMRAMLISFATQHLWLDWKEPALHLARLFTDYEPGIHYAQVQMQAGTTGINTIRIYNPIKQGVDQDPDGVFIREWISELKDMPLESIHTPWHEPLLMNGYPMPIIDEKEARRHASDELYTIRKSLEHKLESIHVVKKHASRKRKPKKKASKKKSAQHEFAFDE